MADKLIFPIGFDLESGLKTAQSDFNRVARQIENTIKRNPVKVPIGFDEATAKRLREEAKDIERVLANIKNHYGSGQLKGLSIGFINTQKEIEGIRRLEAQLQTLQQQRTALVNAGATIQELNKIDAAIRGTEFNLKALTHAFNKDMSSNVAITQQITKLKQLSEELAGIDRMYARLQASASAANRPVNSFEANEMLVRRREIMEEIARVTRTATEAQKELFNIKGVGVGASQGVFGIGREQGLSAITEQISRYETLKKQLQEVEGQYERLKAMQAQGMGDQSEKINQTLQRRIAIQKELGEITQTAAQAQKELEKKAQATSAAFQRGRGAIENFNRVMKLPENRIMNIQQKINLLNQALKRVGINSSEYGKITMELARLGRKLDEAKTKQEALTGAQKKSGAEGSRAFREQSSYLSILIKRLAVYASFDAVNNFLTKVREVTAQFELQRISLGAIINDQARANMLFNEIKQFALKSPIKILDLTKYTKQLAAFRFETDTLFDTTKRMADISVGLSVPMDRLILALGHVKASTYLTGITLRQFSMAGIPMLELLAERFTELEGRAVSTADVVKRVHDKLVSFEDVNQVLIGLTEKGGMFYNMQEKQGNTLYGLWAKLGDAASVMYDQIGNTAAVNKGMKSAIDTLTVMMRNWRDVARIATEAGIAFAVYRLAVIASTKATALATVWEKKDIMLRQMHLKTVMAQSWTVRNFNRVLLASGVSAQKASTATWVFSRALHGLKAAIATTGIGALIIGLALLVDKLLFSKSAAEQLKESLDNIETESIQEQEKSVRNFERLANIAVSASSTYKEQQAALEELKRTYKEIIPQEQLTIENLKQMNGNYELLTASIRRYVAEQMKQKQTDEIINTYAYEILKIQRKISNELKNKYSYEQLAAFWDKYTEIVKDASKSAGKSVSELINMTVSAMGADLQFAHDLGSAWTLFAHDHADVSRMTTLIREQERQIDALSKTYDIASMKMGEYAESYNVAVDKITENGVKLNGAVIEQEDNPLLYLQQKGNLEIKDAMIPTIKEAFNAAGIAFNDGWTSLIDNVDENMPQLTSSINFDPMVEKVNEESQKLLAELQKQLDALVAQREAYLKQIKAEEAKGKGGNDEVIQNAKARYNEIGDEIEKLEERARKINILPQLLEHLKKKYEDLAPSDSVVKLMRQRFDSIVDYTKSYAKNMRRFRMNADEDMEAYRKRLSDEVELIKKNIKAWTAAMVLARLFRNKTEEQNLQNLIDEAKLQLKDLEKILGDMPVFDKSKSRGGTKSDPRLQILNEMVQLAEKLNKEYSDWEKKVGSTKALEKVNATYAETVKYAEKVAKDAGITLPHLKTPTNAKELNEYLEAVRKVMESAKGLKGGKKAAIELAVKMSNNVSAEDQKAIEEKIKALSDRISRTKTAKEFYEKILGMTGDYDLAAKVSLSIYGDTGYDLQKQLAEQVRQYFQNDQVSIQIPVDVITPDNRINYKRLGEFAEQMKKQLGEEPYKAIKKIAEDGQKDLAKTYEGYLKDLEKAKTYADKRIELARTTAAKIREIESNPQYTKEQKAELKRGYQEREEREAAKLEYEAFKDTPLYVQMFEDLEQASTSTLEMMKSRLEALSRVWGTALDPTQLKEIQSRMNEIDTQLRERNPFKTLKESYQEYRDAVKSVSLQGAVENAGAAAKELYDRTVDYGADSAQARAAEKELKAREKIVAIARKITAENKKGAKALDEAAQIANDNLKIARGHLELAKAEEEAAVDKATKEGEDPAKDPGVLAAREKVEAAKEEVNLAERVAEITTNNAKAAKTLKENFASAAGQVVQFMQIGGNLAHAVADTMEALGGDEDDVQFWNDIGTAIDDLTAGFQGIIDSILSLNVAGIISNAIGVIPNMVKGFVGLFSAGKIRKANKEIKRQQKLLEQLEYTYGRLEAAADKAFGADYVANQKQQQKILLAQQQAYMKQYEAEMSKGKKADEEKAQEFLDKARDIGDQIADMQGKIAEQMLGTDLTSAARDFAKAWLDAYKQFGNTADAMSEKFHEMIENMIVESLMAKAMQRALEPAFKMIDEMDEGDFYSEDFWRKVMETADQGSKDANAAGAVIMEWAKKWGYDGREKAEGFTGIAKSVAGATSEEINNVAAIGNTLMYYVSPIPRIDENLARVVALMEGRTAALPAASGGTTGTVDYTEMFTTANQHLSSLPRMEQHLAEIHSMLGRALKTKGSTTGFNTFLNS